MTLNAPMSQQALRLITLCAYFPGVHRDQMIRFLGLSDAGSIQPLIDDLMRRGYLRRAAHNFGGFETVLSEWSPENDVRAQTLQCSDHQHPKVDESAPERLVD